ncbi:MAG: hypothetical protein FJ257_08925 [Phycisphaerae bacterium]|nr:hypothetical protein [Phycisphaerae bacterium]
MPARRPRPSSLLASAVMLVPLAVSTAGAQTYEVVMDEKTSHAILNIGLSVPLAGTFIGNYDPATNPGGTRTLPGLFGGSGNQPIPFSADVSAALDMDEVPSGSMKMVMGSGPAFLMTDMVLDVLGGGTAPLLAGAELTFSSFRTFSPNSLYPGGPPFPITLPIGGITEFRIEQTLMTAGVILPGEKHDTFFVLVPARLTFEMQVLDTTIGGEPIDLLLPMFGGFERNGDSMSMWFSASDSGSNVWSIPIDPLVNEPVELPTILPPGQTANLLFNGEFEDVATSRSLDLAMIGDGTPTNSVADVTGDGLVNGADISEVLGFWGPCPGCAADIDRDGVVNGIDLALVLGLWQPEPAGK